MPSELSAWQGRNLISCYFCTTVQSAEHSRCSFCQRRLHGRKHQSLQRSWVFILTALILYFPANLLPIMTTSELGQQSYSTIVGGVITLWEQGSFLIAGIIFVASVLVPVAKFFALIWLCLCEQFGLASKPGSKTSVYRATEFVGRWSMLDVFVVAFLASLIQMGNVLSIYPGPAALAFGGMVVFTMLAANSTDPRLFWDRHEQ